MLLQVDFCGGNEQRKEGGGSVSSREETLRRTVSIHRRHRKSCLCRQTFPSHWKSASLPSLFTFLTRISSLGYRFEDRRPPAVFVSSPPPTSLNKTNGLSVSQPLSIDPPSERWIGLQGAMVHAEGRAAGQQGWNRVQQSHQVSDVSTPSWSCWLQSHSAHAAVPFSSCLHGFVAIFSYQQHCKDGNLPLRCNNKNLSELVSRKFVKKIIFLAYSSVTRMDCEWFLSLGFTGLAGAAGC